MTFGSIKGHIYPHTFPECLAASYENDWVSYKFFLQSLISRRKVWGFILFKTRGAANPVGDKAL